MSTRHIIYLLLAIAAVTVASALIHQSDAGKDRTETSSTYSTHPKGCKALYLLLENLQLPVDRFRQPFRGLGNAEGALIVIDPHTVPFEREDVAKLEEWVKKGNRLVVFQGSPRGSREKTGKDKAHDEVSGSGSRTDGSSLARRFGLRVRDTKADGRSACAVSTPQLEQVQVLDVSDATRWEKPPEGWDILVADAAGPLVVAKRLARGEILAIADPTIVQNRFLGEAQNARLVIALVGRDRERRTIFFDEYHHGHMFQESFWHYTAASVFAWILLQSAVGLMLFIYSRRAAQAGRFQSLASPSGRSSVEYVDSMANVLSSCKAGSLALEMLLRRFLGHLSRKRGVPLKHVGPDSADQRLMQALGDPEAADIVNQCRQAVSSDAQAGAALRLAKGLQRAYGRLLGVR